MSLSRKTSPIGLLFSGPLIAGLVLFVAYPVLASVYYSLCHFPPLLGRTWVGLDNYVELARDARFHSSMGATLVFALLAIPLGVLLALVLAMLLDARIRGQSVYRVIFYLPHLVPTVATVILWQWMYRKEDGLLNIVVIDGFSWLVHATVKWAWAPLCVVLAAMLAAIPLMPKHRRTLGWTLAVITAWMALSLYVEASITHFGTESLYHPAWHTSPKAAPEALGVLAPSWALWSIIFMSMWGVGQMAIIYLAKLQDVPKDLYEAADIDGANAWHKTWYITIPLISPVILFNVVMGIIGTFQVFTEPYILTGGGPEDKTRFAALFIYQQAFDYQRGLRVKVAFVLFKISAKDCTDNHFR